MKNNLKGLVNYSNVNISKTSHYYEPVKPFSSYDDINLLNTIDLIDMFLNKEF